MIREFPIRTKGSSMPKLVYYIRIKINNDNLPLTFINLCVHIEIYKRKWGEGEGEISGREREGETCLMNE